jgi:hypothetical protein
VRDLFADMARLAFKARSDAAESVLALALPLHRAPCRIAGPLAFDWLACRRIKPDFVLIAARFNDGVSGQSSGGFNGRADLLF